MLKKHGDSGDWRLDPGLRKPDRMLRMTVFSAILMPNSEPAFLARVADDRVAIVVAGAAPEGGQ